MAVVIGEPWRRQTRTRITPPPEAGVYTGNVQKRPWRVPFARYMPLTEVASDFSRGTAEFCTSERSSDQLIRIFHLSCPPEGFILAVELKNSTWYTGIFANTTFTCPRESFSALKAEITKEVGHRHVTTRLCIVGL